MGELGYWQNIGKKLAKYEKGMEKAGYSPALLVTYCCRFDSLLWVLVQK